MKQKKETYFAVDGNYGDNYNMIVVDTSDWTEIEWQRIDEATDDKRADLAARIANERGRHDDEVYTVWLDGLEATDYYVTKQRADQIAAYWTRQGYESVVVERVYF